MEAELSTAIARIDAIRKRPELRDELVALLCERSTIYRGLTAGQAERLRGYVLASFRATGTPAAAMPFVVEELESGADAYAVAGAAKALLGSRDLPSGVRDLLVTAADRIAASDEYVDHDRFGIGGASGSRSAHAEILEAIVAIDRRSHERPGSCCATRPPTIGPAPTVQTPFGNCCDGPGVSQASGPPENGTSIPNAVLQDQSGNRLGAHEFFIGRASVVTFFYTRCMNPEKCSTTITKLGVLQNKLGKAAIGNQVGVAALTYDPQYDLPERLFRYGRERGMIFDERNKLLRSVEAFGEIEAFFQLGVGFGQATVNRHRIELFVLDKGGRIARSFLRAQWESDDVFEAVEKVA